MGQLSPLDKKTEKYHFIAIGGSIMHNLAIDLSVNGHRVTGSDDRIYDPARTNLDRAGLLPEEEGWFPKKISGELTAAILGMHARADNPELKKAQELDIPVLSFPEFVYKKSKNKQRIVVAGSHGKTSISSMIMHILHKAGKDFDYLVGAALDGYDRMVKISNAPRIVIEGDEYLASRIDPRPKFLHYNPDICVISGIAWDHMNVFPTYSDYLRAFKDLIDGMSVDSKIVYNASDSAVKELVRSAKAETIPYQKLKGRIKNGVQYADIGGEEIALRVFGHHNLENLSAALSVGNLLNVPDDVLRDALPTFTGASMRLEKIYEEPDSQRIVFRDFAHAPSKVKATVDAVRHFLPDHRLVVLFELHTFSSINPDFIPQYNGTLDNTDRAGLFYNRSTSIHKGMKPLNNDMIRSAFANHSLEVLDNRSDILTFFQEEDQARTCFLLMSSGRFGGIDLQNLFAH